MKSGLIQTQKLLDSARGDVFPDYALGVFFKGREHFLYGGCGPKTLFDLASLTKALCTTSVIAVLDEKKELPISTPIKNMIPEFPDGRVLVSHLLNHSSGLPAWLPLHEEFHNGWNALRTPTQARETYFKKILQAWKAEDFEKQCLYSDLDMILLGFALERKLGIPIDALFQEHIVVPHRLFSLQFLPISPDVAPTENCPWRKHVLRGEVHDDNCFVLGGVAGHAGLFGNAIDVLKLATLWLRALDKDKESPLMGYATARRFWSFTHVPGSTWALGWDGISPEGSSAGRLFSPQTRGHLGYTGTSLWIDPTNELIVTLLTNRVHPTRANEGIKKFRPVFHDTLLKEIGLEKV